MAPVHYHYDKFPPAELDLPKLIRLIGPARAAVARYDGTLAAVPNSTVLLSPMTTQEAVLSSRIEGTQATMGEVLEFEAKGDGEETETERKADIMEVLNYRSAMRAAVDMLDELPLGQRFIKRTHAILMDGVRGQGKAPGEFRKIPNWIGAPGCSIDEARFVPISADKLPNAMSEWEKYIHGDALDELIKLAILHVEFEALHPFLDGNGRLGRMVIPLFMFSADLIRSPFFYLSEYFEMNKDEYIERLLAVSRDGNWTDWCAFFLEGVRIQAEENQRKASSILSLYEELKPKAVEWTHSQYAIPALDCIFERPIFKSSTFVASAGIPQTTSQRILRVFRENNLLKTAVEGRGRRAATYIFSDLLNIAEGRDVF